MTLREQLTALRAKRQAAVSEAEALIQVAEGDGDGRDLTAEEQTEFDRLMAEADALEKRAARIELALESRSQDQGREESRNRDIRGMARDTGSPGPTEHSEFRNFGEFLFSIRHRPNDPRLGVPEPVGGAEARADMLTSVDEFGGYALPEQFVDAFRSVPPQEAIILPRASIIPAGDRPDVAYEETYLEQDPAESGAAPANIYGGVAVAWIAEGATKPATDMKIGKQTWTPQELAASADVSDKNLRNWRAVGGRLEQQFRAALVGAQERAFFRGTGTGQPLGMIASPAALEVDRATANQINLVDVQGMIARILMRGGGTPIWQASQQVLPQLLNLKYEDDSPAWQANARDGFAGTLSGYPLAWNEWAPALGARGDLTLSVLSHYVIKEGAGPFFAASPHVRFRENMTVFKIFTNVDGKPWLKVPVTLEGGYQVSPFVVLDVPAA